MKSYCIDLLGNLHCQCFSRILTSYSRLEMYAMYNTLRSYSAVMFSQKWLLQSNFVVPIKEDLLPCLRIWNVLVRFSAMPLHCTKCGDLCGVALFCDHSSCLKSKKGNFIDQLPRQRNHRAIFFAAVSQATLVCLPYASSYIWFHLPNF